MPIAPWSPERARAWLAATPWLAGCNYLPASAVNSTEMWAASSFDPDTIARELELAGELGLGALRVFLPWIVWRQDPEGFLTRFSFFLELAESAGLRVMPVLFDDCAFSGRQPYAGPQDPPRPGLHNSGWTPSPGHANADDPALEPELEAYVAALLGRFGTDPRVWLWDLYNEPGNAQRGAASHPLLERVFEWARAATPQQPLTAGLWEGPPDEPMNRLMLERSDVVSFHIYEGLEATRRRVRELAAAAPGRPLLCSEWMARSLDSRFPSHLPAFQRAGIPCLHWGHVSGRTQTHLPWESREGDAPPALWFHDLFHPDHHPYDDEEIRLIRSHCQVARQEGPCTPKPEAF